jgi:phosphoribosyl 1,2-cyclic phosphodiesterase
MRLSVLGSSSKGNCYLLYNQQECLILEAGLGLKDIKKKLLFDISRVVGAVVSHQHGDHSKAVKDLVHNAIPVVSGEATFIAKGIPLASPFAKVIRPGKGVKMGNFKILAFDVAHDVPCLGFHISHPDMGNLLFVTDTYLLDYSFDNLDHIMIEANYADYILEKNIREGIEDPSMRPRLLQTHMELETTKRVLKGMDLERVKNIVLLHLSARNSDQGRFLREVSSVTGKVVFAAHPKMSIDISNNPY